MARYSSTLLLITLGASFLWHVISMIFLSSVVVVKVGNPDAGYRRVDFTEIDFDYQLAKNDAAPPITKHFKPPTLPEVADLFEPESLEPVEGNRKRFDTVT